MAEELDRTKRFPYEIVEKLAGLGLMGMPFPEEYGGGGRRQPLYALAVEELGRVDSSVAITLAAHTSLGTWPIYAFGSEEQKQHWLPRALRGEKLGASASRSPRPARTPATRARGRARRRRLGDRRRQAVHHQRRHRHLRLRDDHGADGRGRDLQHHGAERHARLRDRRALPQDGLERLGHAAAEFDGLPRARGEPARPAREGFKQFLQTLDGGRIGVAAMGVGLAQGALDEALAYAKERKAFGQPISKFQAIQAKLADMSTEIEAARLLPTRPPG